MRGHQGTAVHGQPGWPPVGEWRGPDRRAFAVAAVVLGLLATLGTAGVVALVYGWFGRTVEDPAEGYEIYGAFLVLAAGGFSAVVGAIGFGLAIPATLGADDRPRTRRLGALGLGLSVVPYVAFVVALLAVLVGGAFVGG